MKQKHFWFWRENTKILSIELRALCVDTDCAVGFGDVNVVIQSFLSRFFIFMLSLFYVFSFSFSLFIRFVCLLLFIPFVWRQILAAITANKLGRRTSSTRVREREVSDRFRRRVNKYVVDTAYHTHTKMVMKATNETELNDAKNKTSIKTKCAKTRDSPNKIRRAKQEYEKEKEESFCRAFTHCLSLEWDDKT